MTDTYLANRNYPPCPICGRRWSLEAEPELLGREPTREMICNLFEGGCGYHFVVDEDGRDVNLDQLDPAARLIRKHDGEAL